MRHYGTFNIFADFDFDSYSRARIEQLKETVRRENPDYILNVNPADYIAHLVSTLSIDPLVLHFDNVEGSSREEMIPAEQFPSLAFFVDPGQSYSKPVITYHIPVTGDIELLKCIPNPHVLSTYEVSLESGAICFDVVDFYGKPEDIKGQADLIIGTLKTQSDHLSNNISGFNAALQSEAESVFNARREELLKRTNTLAALGIPIRKATNVPQTFAVPAQRKQIAPRPTPTGSSAKPPHPTLDEGIYQEILQTIHDVGKVFERLPRTYADKDEEALRDHLILQLEPRFVYSTTGETFNKTGKTDILVRHEKNNIFVAECKFWGGAKKHFETIDQVLSYLTWRDSKTAIVYFMNTKEMAAPLKAIEEETAKHQCFVKFNGRKYASWFDYTFHLPGDDGVHIRLSILCFHLPTQP
jgi:hypothetical protein